ncbi:phosphate-selective porin O/P [Arcticibacter pallidicorallinus]|uniref:Phosphate-selective porin O/P n=1 Tax=Arcticibacter pallidicorallinus TaxID=1259464 RepID=A0A2T0U3C0_9SPHI|nr:porin [Arcticibacter pallidicorallinus]PRY52413.1 phosphate-selective porin O/P [Arcticibacter pallidicorallinus]
MRIYFTIFSFILAAIPYQSKAQEDSSAINFSNFRRSTNFSGLVQFRYTYSMTDSVDVGGNPCLDKGVSNSFSLKRVRVMLRTDINDRLDANVMVNLADFSGNPQAKVLENAFIRYRFSPAFNVQMGQFRPFFGAEDIYPVDVIKSLDYSNQYYLFSSSGWQGFQLGITVFGQLKPAKVPLRYYVGVYNGNNRNQAMDNDNGKNFYARLEAECFRHFTVGVNGAVAALEGESASAWGVDAAVLVPVADRLKLDLSAEYKQGADITAFKNADISARNPLGQYQNRGFYFFPNLRYEYKHPRLRSVEISSRYEFLDEDYHINRNQRQTLTPMLSLEFTDDYFARLQLGYTMEMFNHQTASIPKKKYNIAVAQMQVRF